MSRTDDIRFEEALEWVRRIADPAFEDWDAHCAWLERDPANASAFDEASMLVEEATAGLAPEPSFPAGRTAWRSLPAWAAVGGMAIAASLVAVLVLPQQQVAQPVSSILATAPGQRRDLALADGTRVSLNGDTALEIDPAEPRHVRLAHGQAFFTVVHDGKSPFSVVVGGDEIRDVGTAFDVKLDRGDTTVAVREGMVLYRSAGKAVALHAGMTVRSGSGVRLISTVDPMAVGGWSHGQLRYSDAPLTVLAEDLSRIIGSPITVDPRLRDRRVSGVFMTDGDHGKAMNRIGAILGLTVLDDGNGWRMVPRRR